MLSGRVPFSAENQLDLLQKISYEKPVSLRHKYPHFPIICDEILARALHKQPEGRYPDMAALGRTSKLHRSNSAL